MKISIIMPVYNASEFVEKTINSIIMQKYKEWELIVIDDCSTDNSYEIVKKISEKDNRIKVLKNEENLGISGNRNKGLKNANGEYIAFCDDDDFYTENLLYDNVKILEDNSKIDMIKFGRRLISVDSKGKIFDEKDTITKYEGLIKNEEKYNLYFTVRTSDTLYNLWNGIYSKRMLMDNNILFDETMKFGGEDADFSYKCYISSNQIYINSNIYYYHYKRDITSTSRKYNENKIHSIIKAMNTEFKIWEKIDFEKIDNQVQRIIALNINVNNIMFSQIFHKKSDLKYKRRKELYYNIKKNMLDGNYIINKDVKETLWKNNKKNYIITNVINSNKYFIIDAFYKICSILKNRKWK